jgi:myosin heavy subunit
MQRRFAETIETLELVGASEEDIKCTLEILAGILHLGQLNYVSVDGDNEKSMVDPKCEDVANTVASLFRLDMSEFLKGTTTRRIEIVGEEMEVPLTMDQVN